MLKSTELKANHRTPKKREQSEAGRINRHAVAKTVNSIRNRCMEEKMNI